jgi:hypothetical protein
MRVLVLLLALMAAGCGGIIQPATSPPSYGHISGGGGA